MPIYEFRCQACDHVFDLLVLAGDQIEMKCPQCDSPEVVKLMSTASHNLSGPGGSGRGASLGGVTSRACDSGSCATIDIPGRYD